MAFKSEAQRKKFAQLVKEGKMSQAVFDEFELNSPKDLPDRAKRKPKTPKKRKFLVGIGE